ncbi:MAG: hypothetical protein J5896_02920 [Alphaproteobacteria bacterium]|nr:hypothetical protein [Alphaproteobacteria bacterium]
MKKIVSFVALMFGVLSCQNNKQMDYEPQQAAKPQAYYADWDRAVRADIDMQNMYLNAPRQIKKPIDMYMAMALALKYNYTRRMVSMEENLLKAGNATQSQLQDILNKAGYINTNNSDNLSPDLKVAWNILDMSTLAYQNTDSTLKQNLSVEQSRKVIHNVLQEARVLYWKTLTAQRLLPVIDDMSEYLTLEVDEMNVKAKELALVGEAPSQEELQKKRKYMEAVKNLNILKHKLETAQTNLATLMGLHPTTDFKLVGTQYGNFELPEIKTNLNQLEWMALTNRPELRAHDLIGTDADKEMIVTRFNENQNAACRENLKAYDKCSKESKELAFDMMESLQKANDTNLERLRRERLTQLILNQVYVAWAQYMAAMEDYQINSEISDTSENIAEDLTFTDGSKNEKSQLEASRAVEDEVKAFMSYVDVQEALGTLYTTLGLDAVPYYMLNEKPSDIAFYLRQVYKKWAEGDLLPDNRPYLMDVPVKRPPVKISARGKLKDVTVETGEPIFIEVPLDIFNALDFEEVVSTSAGLIDDAPLPKWLTYQTNDHCFKGRALPGDGGVYRIKVYGTDAKGNVGYDDFKLTVREVYTPSTEMRGLTEGRQATVMAHRPSLKSKDAYVNQETIGREVEKAPIIK